MNGKMPRILYLSPSYITSLPDFMHKFGKWSAEKGFEIDVVAPQFEGTKSEESIEGVKIHRFGKNLPIDLRGHSPIVKAKFALSFLAKADEIYKSKKFDAIHAFFAVPAGFIAHWIAKKKTPYAVHLLGSDIYNGLKSPAMRPFVKSAISNASFVFSDGKEMVDLAVQNGCSVKRQWVHSWGLDLARLDKKIQKRLEKNWGVKKGCKVLLVIRARARHYGASYFIDALPKVLERHENLKAVIVDKIPEDLMHEFSSRAKELGVEKNLVFPGFLNKEEFRAALEIADVYVTPSVQDSISISLLSAMAVGLPIVATDIGDTRLWVKDRANGIIVKPASPEGLSEGINAVLAMDRKQLKKMSQYSINEIKKRCSWERLIDQLSENYFEMIEDLGK